MLKKGDKAPDFLLLSDKSENISLKNYSGKRLVLYFYPKDDTSGCTKEALEFTANIDKFKTLNAEIVGVSPDSVESHAKFKVKHAIDIMLLSDKESIVAKEYGAYGDKSMYGRVYQAVIRSTFIISPDGVIEEAYYNVKVTGHAEKIYCELAK